MTKPIAEVLAEALRRTRECAVYAPEPLFSFDERRSILAQTDTALARYEAEKAAPPCRHGIDDKCCSEPNHTGPCHAKAAPKEEPRCTCNISDLLVCPTHEANTEKKCWACGHVPHHETGCETCFCGCAKADPQPAPVCPEGCVDGLVRNTAPHRLDDPEWWPCPTCKPTGGGQ